MTIDLADLQAATDSGLPDELDSPGLFLWLVALGVNPDDLGRVLNVVVEGMWDAYDLKDVPEPVQHATGEIALAAFAIGLVAGRNDR